MRALIALALAAGCAGDPCAGYADTCVTAVISAGGATFSQLRFGLTGYPTSLRFAQGPFTLPAELALELPGVAGPIELSIEGMVPADVIGRVIASRRQKLTLAQGEHRQVDVSLAQVPSVDPVQFGFAPTAVGATSAAPADFTFHNSVGAALTISAIDFGDTAFVPENESTCKVGARLPAGGDCKLTVSFQPEFAGNHGGEIEVLFDNGGVQKAAVSGTAQ